MAVSEFDLLEYLNTAANVASARYNAQTAAAARRTALALEAGNREYRKLADAVAAHSRRRELVYQANKAVAEMRQSELCLNTYIQALTLRKALDEGDVTTESLENTEDKRTLDEINQYLGDLDDMVTRQYPDWKKMAATAQSLQMLGDKLQLCLALAKVSQLPKTHTLTFRILTCISILASIYGVSQRFLEFHERYGWALSAFLALVFSLGYLLVTALLGAASTSRYRRTGLRTLPDWVRQKAPNPDPATVVAELEKVKTQARFIAGTDISDFGKALTKTETCLALLHARASLIKATKWQRP